jgi:uncharacterized protein (TIGR03118 family)
LTLFRRRSRTTLALAFVAPAVAVAAAVAVIPSGAAHAWAPTTTFAQVNLVSDQSTDGAQIVDPDLINAWGLALSATSPLWVANNNSDTSTLYSIGAAGASVSKVGLTVNTPGPAGNPGAPTGQVFNGGTGFVVTSASGSGPARFIFSSESGEIIAWNPAADPATAGVATASVAFTSPTAVYKGLAIATNDTGTFLYASNIHDGTVDVFNSSFQPVTLAGGFQDPFLPPGYAPFGIQNIHGLMYVTYAKQNAAKDGDVPGAGRGFIDVYTTDGFLVERLVSRGGLNAPWGMAVAPSTFGQFAGKLLVGNFGDGRVHAYGLFNGIPAGPVLNTMHEPLTIPGLWALVDGTASTGGTGSIIFSAGPGAEAHGLIGVLNPA